MSTSIWNLALAVAVGLLAFRMREKTRAGT
jgi:hypothetical protein